MYMYVSSTREDRLIIYEIRAWSKFSKIRTYKEILCTSRFKLNPVSNFWFCRNQNNLEIISYYKPLARQFDKVKCPKHKNQWFVVRNNFGIVLVFRKPKILPQDLIQTSLYKGFLHIFRVLRICSIPHFNFENPTVKPTSSL